MKYFKGDGVVYAYNSDGSQDDFIKPGLVPITEKEAIDLTNPPPTHDDLVAEAERRKVALLTEASFVIAPLADALVGGYIDAVDEPRLVAWQKHRYMLTKVDTSTTPDIDWPEAPADVA
ncbi:tail fiber assembly protein [Yersinia ruckeri]|uniref:tail fiber assembly protein n=1 Tax=Yersinia ruckeri TaxID=29486 RepID=UPI0020BD58A7|nr:tail fiber assembly protein [Yersinia ruckeri]EKN4181780.1 tail fiber assembly protein [Yersinia ruckeri]MCK8554467.1 tail fiber assembly protein [Yersinia ruckeri]